MPELRNEQSLDVVAPIEVERQLHDLVRRKARPLHIRRGPVDAVGAVINAEVGQQHLEQRDAAPIRRVGMADRPFGRADAAGLCAVSPLRSAGRTGCIILGRIGENRQLSLKGELHGLFTIRSRLGFEPSTAGSRQFVIDNEKEPPPSGRGSSRTHGREAPVPHRNLRGAA